MTNKKKEDLLITLGGDVDDCKLQINFNFVMGWLGFECLTHSDYKTTIKKIGDSEHNSSEGERMKQICINRLGRLIRKSLVTNQKV